MRHGFRSSRSPSSLVAWIALLFASLVSPVLSAAESAEDSTPTSPWASLWISSLGRAMAACDLIFESVQRPDLADSLEDRLTDYRAFAGIDRKKPLGLMWTWHDVEPAATIFLPVGDINELLKTATFGVVGFHQVKADQYEIERPGVPYHVLLRAGFALFGEDVVAMQALRQSPDQLTKPLRDKYDVVLNLDFRQVPRASKTLWIEELRKQVDPWLQRQDSEPAETATLRRAVGLSVLGVVERLVFDVRTITFGGRIDAERRQLSLELLVQSESGSALAGELNRLVSRRSEFSALMNQEATASLAINWPLPEFGKESATGGQVKGARLNAGIQIVGGGWGESAVLAGMHGPEAAALNAAIPRMIVNLEKSKWLTSVKENQDIYRGVVLHSVVPSEIPDQLKQLVGPEVEVLIGQGKQTVWFAAGNPETLSKHLQQAIDAVEDTPASERTGSLMSAKFSSRKLPTAPPAATPTEPNAVPVEAPKVSDEFRLSVEPVADGLKIRLVAEEGILHWIGRDWVRQIEEQNAAQ